jgi:DNA topoisomerase-2
LVNGAKGIGTGFSTDIPNYNPVELIDYLMNKITTPSFKKPLTPYFEGFKGVIEEQSTDKFITRGIWKLIKKDCVHVTELPIGMWTETYKQFLEKIIIQGQTLGEKKKSILRDYKDMSTDAMVDFTLMFSPGKLDISTPEAIAKFEKDYHLTSSINTSNMYLFNEAQKILKYKNVEEIIDNFYGVRRNYYHIRKQNLLEKLNQLVNLLSNKYRFIKEQIDDKLDLRGKKMDDIVKELTTRKYDVIDGNYKYLISMPISSVIKENLERLKKDREEKIHEMKELEKTEPEALWYKELEHLKIEYERYIKQRINRVYGDI